MNDAKTIVIGLTDADRLKLAGFVPCEFGPEACDRCKTVAPLYFGNTNYYDAREGDYWCAACVDARIAADAESMSELDRLIIEAEASARRIMATRQAADKFVADFIRESCKGYGGGGARQFGRALEQLGKARPKPQPPKVLTAEERAARAKKLKRKMGR